MVMRGEREIEIGMVKTTGGDMGFGDDHEPGLAVRPVGKRE